MLFSPRRTDDNDETPRHRRTPPGADRVSSTCHATRPDHADPEGCGLRTPVGDAIPDRYARARVMGYGQNATCTYVMVWPSPAEERLPPNRPRRTPGDRRTALPGLHLTFRAASLTLRPWGTRRRTGCSSRPHSPLVASSASASPGGGASVEPRPNSADC